MLWVAGCSHVLVAAFASKLLRVELSIAAVLSQQFCMGAGFNNLALFKHQNSVGPPHRCQTVGNDKYRAVSH